MTSDDPNGQGRDPGMFKAHRHENISRWRIDINGALIGVGIVRTIM